MNGQMGFPLQPMLNAEMTLCKIISKLERKAHFRLKRTNIAMFNFIDTNKKLIKFNVLRDEVLKVKNKIIDVGFAELSVGTYFVRIEEKGTGNSTHSWLDVEDLTVIFQGSKPKEIYFNSTSWEELDALRVLRLAHGSIVTYDQAIDVCRLKALTNILKPDELCITEECDRINEEKPKLKGFPLTSLISSPICQIISKLDRTTYFRLQQTNKTMFNFMNANKHSIKPNPLRDAKLTITETGFDLGFAIFKLEGEYFKILEKGTGNTVNYGVSLEQICEVLQGSKPKEIIYNSFNWSDLELLRDLNLAPGSIVSCRNVKDTHLCELMTIQKPKELEIIKCIVNNEDQATNVFELFKKEEFKCLKSIRLSNFETYMNSETFLQALFGLVQGRNPWRNLGKQDPIEMGGVLEWITSFQLEGAFNEFPVDDIKQCVQNWCNGTNQIEFFSMRTTKPNIHTPVMWMVLGDENERATNRRVSELPVFMEKAFEADTAGTLQNYNRQVDLRVIRSPTHTAYIYVTLVGTLGFRSFENRLYNFYNLH